jgi:hypothetical protein
MRLHTLIGMKAEDICITFISFIKVILEDDVVLYSQMYEVRGPTHCIPMHTLK